MSHACETRAGLIHHLTNLDLGLSGFNFICCSNIRPQLADTELTHTLSTEWCLINSLYSLRRVVVPSEANTMTDLHAFGDGSDLMLPEVVKGVAFQICLLQLLCQVTKLLHQPLGSRLDTQNMAINFGLVHKWHHSVMTGHTKHGSQLWTCTQMAP